MNFLFSRISELFIGLIIAIGLIAGAPGAVSVLQELEGELMPVTGRVKIVTAEADGPDQTKIWVLFEKRRDCEFIGVSWYRGKPQDVFERVRITFARDEGDQSDRNRTTGHQKAGPWTLGLPFEELTENSFAVLSHRCHPFWITKTQFYP